LVSCKKDWLDARPNKNLVVPSTVADYQALLDNNVNASAPFNHYQPGLGEIGTTDFYIPYTNFQALYEIEEKNVYTYAHGDIYQGEPDGGDWQFSYGQILICNIVLNGLPGVVTDSSQANDQAAWNNAKGIALFYRSYAFYGLAQEFAVQYDSATAATDPGIVLRLSSDVKQKSVRSSVQQSYDQIIGDLRSAVALLPVTQVSPSRPSKAAAYGMLARVYLTAGDYAKAGLYADSSLQLNSSLVDFNTLDPKATVPLVRFNTEMLYYHVLNFFDAFDIYTPNCIIDSTLYASYAANDLRKVIYFQQVSGYTTYKGYFYNDWGPVGGLTTDEQYLIRAECKARGGDMQGGMTDLNTLLASRWVTGTFVPYTASNADDALRQILTERRKELILRGLRWTDLRRLNKDPRFAVTLTRVLNGQTYTLPPNDPRYVFTIPDIEIQESGIQQNQR